MAVYSERYKYVFFAVPNTASKAVAKTLREKLDGVTVPDKSQVGEGEWRHHATPSQLVRSGCLTEEQLKNVLKFTTIRNPFDAMVSKYVKHCERKDKDPAQYPWLKKAGKAQPSSGAGANKALPVENVDLAEGYQLWLQHIEEKYAKVEKLESGPMDILNQADVVMRFETLQKDFEDVQRRLGLKEVIAVESFNQTPGRQSGGAAKLPYQRFYNETSVGIVRRMYEPILQRFGYQFDAI